MDRIFSAILTLTLLGAGFGLLLVLASRFLTVKKDPREEAVLDLLPGVNCGGCGYDTCAACAAAVAEGEVPVTACGAVGPEGAASIAAIMGQDAPAGEKSVAFVRCNGGLCVKERYAYVGIEDCLAAEMVAGGLLACTQGCLGCGSCVERCKFDALRISAAGTAVVNPRKCTNCMACAAACPRGLIVSVPAGTAARVACANTDAGEGVREICEVSCTGCGLCQQVCRFDAIHLDGNVPIIDYDHCADCGDCARICPRDAIFPLFSDKEKEEYRAARQMEPEQQPEMAREPEEISEPAAEN